MIVGAGIVGTYLGALMGDARIFESSPKLIEKPCSGLLSASGLNALRLPYKGSIVHEIKGAKISSGTHSLTVKKKTAQAYVLDRFGLQKDTLQMALDNNCSVEWERKWKGDKEGFVIGADGALSAVAAGMGIKRNYIYTYQIRADYKAEDDEIVYLYFSKEYAPGFFAWIIPEGERTARIGVGVNRGNAGDAFKSFVAREGIKIGAQHKVQAGIIPIYDGQRIVHGNKALIGDAAAQVKATTGGGIIFGCKAAHILKEAVDRNDLALYQSGFERKYGRDMRLHKKIRGMLDREDNDAIIRRLMDNGVPALIEKYGDMDHPMALAKHMMLRPGLWGMARHFL